jgi:hypothetical protein
VPDLVRYIYNFLICFWPYFFLRKLALGGDLTPVGLILISGISVVSVLLVTYRQFFCAGQRIPFLLKNDNRLVYLFYACMVLAFELLGFAENT